MNVKRRVDQGLKTTFFDGQKAVLGRSKLEPVFIKKAILINHDFALSGVRLRHQLITGGLAGDRFFRDAEIPSRFIIILPGSPGYSLDSRR